MAQIQYTGLVSGMQGKLNGSVLSRGRSGNVIYKKPVQRLAPTAAQLEVRAGFSAAATAWNSLTTGEQTDWATISDENPLPDRFGVPRIVSGYAYFKRMMALRYPTAGGSPLIANLAGNAAYEFETGTFGAEMTLTDEGYQVNFAALEAETISDSPVANFYNLYISLPVPNAVNPYFRTWYLVTQGTFGASLGIGATLDFVSGPRTLPSGFRSFDGALHLWKGITFLPGQGSVSVEQIWSGVASWVGPVTFPVFSYPGDMPSISVDGSNGIFDYYWFSTEKAAIQADFTFQTEWAPAQADTSPPDEGDWFAPASTGVSGSGGPTTVIPTVPGGPNGWYDPWYAEVSSSLVVGVTVWAPIRARLIHIGSGAEGPWVTAFWPIGWV